MPAVLDLTGKRFGRLTGVRFVGVEKRLRVWRFICDCGVEIDAKLIFVTSGKTSSCGCLRRHTTAGRKGVDLTGEVFGRLTVLGRDGANKHGQVVWRCACDCGAQTCAPTGILKRGDKQSCGCLRRESTSALGRSSKQDNPKSKTPEYRREARRRRLSLPIPSMQARISRHLRRALARLGVAKANRTFDYLGFTPSELAGHLERQFVVGMGWHNTKDWQIDHIIPASSATSESDVRALNQLSNLRPLWSEMNNLKRDKRQTLL